MTDQNPMKETEEKQPNKGGRPPVWSSPEELDIDIQSYKLFCQQNENEIPDIESFCYFVQEKRQRDSLDRKTFFNYEDKEGFSSLIKNVKTFIAHRKKQLGLQGKIPAAIFCFDFKNNHDYVDTQKVDQNTVLSGTGLQINVITEGKK